LPAGLSIGSTTGRITGTATTAVTSSVTVTATNTTGDTGSTSFTWTVSPSGGSPNLALNKPATGSTPCNANEGPAKAFNGSVSGGNSDKWCSSATPRILTVDLGSTMAISSFTVRHAQAGGESATFNTRDFDLQVSNDGTTFTTVVQARGNTAAVTNHSASTSGRFVRLNVLTPTQGTDNHARIYELEVYGPGGGTPTNLALNRPATGSTPCASTEGPEKAFNGSVSGGNSDKWCSGDPTRILTVDLGSSMAIHTFTVRHAQAGGEDPSFNTRDFDIQVSNDGVTFTTPVQVRGNTAAVTNHSVSTSGRYVRLNALTPDQGTDGHARIYELEVYA